MIKDTFNTSCMINCCLLSLICILSLLIFSGYSIGWASMPYDEWRLLVTTWLGILPIISFLFGLNTLIYSSLSHLSIKILIFTYVFLLLYVFLVPKDINSLSLLLIYGLIINAVLTYSMVFSKVMFKNIFLITMSMAPLLTVIWLPIETFLVYSYPGQIGGKAWIGNFINIRQYDDAVLPLLFLLAFARVPKRYNIFRWVIWCLIFSGSVHNGARAVLLSIFLGILFSICWYRKWRWAKTLIMCFIGAIGLALVFSLLQNLPPLDTLQRYHSSGRTELIIEAFSNIKYHWVLGVDTPIDYKHVYHPHNLFLQLVADYGLLGMWIVAIVVLLWLLLLKKSHMLHPLAICSITAILLNALLSGSMLYPHSQLFNIMLIAYVVHLYIKTDSGHSHSIKIQNMLGILIILMGLTLLFLQMPNLHQWGSGSDMGTDSQMLAPYWWQYGATDWLKSRR